MGTGRRRPEPHQRQGSFSRTTASERLQTVEDDGRSATREFTTSSSWLYLSAAIVMAIGCTSATENPCSHNFHPAQFGILPKRLSLQYPDAEILSGYEEDVSSIRDGFSAWVKSDPEAILHRHIVDAKGADPAFREAPLRKHAPTEEEYRFDADVPNHFTEPKRFSIYNWKPGPRREKGGAIEKHLVGEWHVITLQ